jgi:hypothetical protein
MDRVVIHDRETDGGRRELGILQHGRRGFGQLRFIHWVTRLLI